MVSSASLQRNPRCVRAWIIFSCLGILVEMGLILYAVFNESSFQMGLIKNGLLLMLGLQCIFLYIVYRFYVTLALCQACHKAIERKVIKPHREPKHERQSQTRVQPKNRSQIQHHRGKIVHNTPSHPRKLSFLQSSNSNLSP
ncbi:hypothetical protein M5D96_006603 [Drosophila gunungcola]|uniref:Uncharacterized protein n=1 Tax=Drosophila gunungcola TaxID=103775 RepID=A0A9P9YP94_9MUSC|nr:hypothetical protein M5D96_006603 [Drosophila gunungcola]